MASDEPRALNTYGLIDSRLSRGLNRVSSLPTLFKTDKDDLRAYHYRLTVPIRDNQLMQLRDGIKRSYDKVCISPVRPMLLYYYFYIFIKCNLIIK